MMIVSEIYQHPKRHVLYADGGLGQLLHLLDPYAGIRMSAVYVGADKGFPSLRERWFLVPHWPTSRSHPPTRLRGVLPSVRF
jgi:hypothetical protein